MNKVVVAAGATILSISLMVPGSIGTAAGSNVNQSPTKIVQQVDTEFMTAYNASPVSYALPTTAKAVIGFKDVKGHWAESAIMQAVKDGYVGGYADGTFKPSGQITRAEFLAIFVRATNIEGSGATANFSDVPKTHWAYAAVQDAISVGFIKASDFANGQFKPNQAMTRFEMAKWMTRGLMQADASFVKAFEDVQGTILPFSESFKGEISQAQIPYVAIARGTGLLTGYADGSFGINKPTTRAETVVLLSRYLQVEKSKAEDHFNLSELREIGQYGTNIVTMGHAEWAPAYGEKASFYNIMNKDFDIKGKGTAKLKYYILVDAKQPVGSPKRGVFADVFWDKNKVSPGNGYLVFSYMDLKVNSTMTSLNTFTDAITYITGQRLTFEKLSDMYGYPHIQAGFGDGRPYDKVTDYLKAGATRSFWSQDSLRVNDWLDAKTKDGTTAVFKVK